MKGGGRIERDGGGDRERLKGGGEQVREEREGRKKEVVGGEGGAR